MTDLQNVVRETLSYKLFHESGKKHIYGDEFHQLRLDIVSEGWGACPETTMNGAMAWTWPKFNAVREVLEEDNVRIHFDDEYEVLFKEWYDKQEHPKGVASLEHYSAKRKEFDAIYKKEKECWDSENT